MAEKIKVTVAVMIVGSFLMGPVLAQQPSSELVASMPEGEGKLLVANICAGCHSLENVTTQRRNREDWNSTVADMISRGAQIFTDESATIVNYLAEHYGPGAVSGAQAASGSSSDSSPAGGLFRDKCFQCHGETMWRDLKQDRRAWEGTLYRMVGRGALWTEEEINTMADYLVQINGPQ
jgi:mono/diheme cytochrome c family protein